MPLPPVVVEISAPRPDAALIDALLAACSFSAKDAECTLAPSYQGKPTAVAIVSWQDEFTVQVQVGLERAGNGRWVSRRLEFRPGDPALETWKTTGFIIGTLAGELSAPPALRPRSDVAADPTPATQPSGVAPVTKPAPRPSSKTKSSAPSQATETAPEEDVEVEAERKPGPPLEPALWLDMGGVAGPGLTLGPWRFGGFLRAALSAKHLPVFVTLATSYALRARSENHQVELSWLGGSAGLGLAPFGTRAQWLGIGRLELLGQLLTASANLGDGTDTQQRWVGSLVTGLDLAWLPAGPLGIVVGGEVVVTPGATEFTLTNQHQPVGSTRSLSFMLNSALRLRFE